LNTNFHLAYAGQARERLSQLAGSDAHVGNVSSSDVRGSNLGGPFE
jgi:hypothetical protein